MLRSSPNPWRDSMELERQLTVDATVEEHAELLARLWADADLAGLPIDYPECVCTRAYPRSWETIKDTPLDGSSPLFQPLNDLIGQLKRARPQISDDVHEVIELYRSFIGNVCERKGDEQIAKLTGPARLYGLKQVWCLAQDTARKMASVDLYNAPHQSNTEGASAVAQVAGTHIKRARLGPLRPGVEFAVDSFGKQLFGEGTAASCLLRLHGIFVLDSQDESSRGSRERQELVTKQSQLRRSTTEIFDEDPAFRGKYPLVPKRITHMVQASLTVHGEGLYQQLMSDPHVQVDGRHYSVCFANALLLRRTDDRADNYGHGPVGIDNDGALEEVIAMRNNTLRLNLRCILFAMDQRKDPIHQTVFERLRDVDAGRLILDWLHQLAQKNEEYRQLERCGVLHAQNMDELQLPIRLTYRQIEQTFAALLAMQQLCREKHPTHWELFEVTYPLIARVYDHLLSPPDITPLQVQEKLFPVRSQPDLRVLLADNETLLAQVEAHPLPEERDLPLPPASMASRWLQSVQPRGADHQHQLLEHALGCFPDLEELHFDKIYLSDGQLTANLRKAQHIQALTIGSSDSLTKDGILTVLHNKPHLKLVLGPCNGLSADDIGEIIQYCWHHRHVLFLLVDGHGVDIREEQIDAALYRCCKSEQFFFVDALLSCGASLRSCDGQGQPLLHRTLQLDSIAPLKYLLGKGVDPNTPNSRDWRPLHLVAKGGKIEAARALIEACAQLDARLSGGETFLHIAVEYGQLPFIQQLEEAKELIDTEDGDGKRPIHKACWGNEKVEIARHLLDLGSSVNAKSTFEYRPVHWAAKHGHRHTLQLLIERGAELNLVNVNGHLPIDLAFLYGQDMTALQLISPELANRMQQTIVGIGSMEDQALEQQVKKALAAEGYDEAIFWLLKYVTAAQAKRNYEHALTLANAAFRLAQQHRVSPPLFRYLPRKLKAIEWEITTDICGREPIGHGKTPTAEGRQRIMLACKEAIGALGREDTIAIAKELSTHYRDVFAQIAGHATQLLGKSPCDFACVGFGDLAKGDGSLTTAIPWIIITADESTPTIDYFTKFAHLVNIMTINLAGTSCPLVGTPPGLHTDEDLNPICRLEPLIGTAANLRQRCTNQHFSCLLYGSKKTLKGWQQECKPERGELLPLIGGAYSSFPRLDAGKTHRIDIETDLLTPFSTLLSALVFWKKGVPEDPAACIETLRRKKLFSQRGADNLLDCYDLLLTLRFEAHRRHRRQIVILGGKGGQVPLYEFIAEADHEACLRTICGVLQRLSQALEIFVTSGGKKRRQLQDAFKD